MIEEIIKKLKKQTNNIEDITYRKKIIHNKKIYLIYNEPLTSSDKISDFIIRSLNNIELNYNKRKNLLELIENNISNFKTKRINTYENICTYLHQGFTIILIEGEKEYIALETKANITRSIATPDVENSLRGAKDSFVEDYQKNIGLVKKRIKSNDLWIDTLNLGRYTKTKTAILYINKVAKEELVNKIKKRIENIDIDGIVNIDIIKNIIIKENKSILPTIISTERPDTVSNALLDGKIVILADNCPFALIMPAVLNDFFKTPEDYYNKSINASLTRVLKYLSFFIALLFPAIYIALITYNQEMIPTELLISFSIQRDGVPFPAFFEAFIMMISFEILRESDLRVPAFAGSSLSIVGALILGEAAVNAGIVSPIMIIVIALTSICSLPFTEIEIINSLRWYRLLFMVGASTLGIIGLVFVFIYFLLEASSLKSWGKPYLLPFAPTSISELKDSIIRMPLKDLKKRPNYLSDNHIKQKDDQNE